MSVTISFYQTSSKKIVINKTITTALQWTLTGLLYTPCEVENPIVEIEETTDVNPLNFSYCKIANFSRYYYITKRVAMGKGRWMLYMHEDVLMSHSTYILGLEAFIERNENTYSKLLKDEQVSFKYKNSVAISTPSSGSLVNTTFSTEVLPIDNCFTVTVINNTASDATGTTNSPTNTSLPNVGEWVSGVQMFSKTYITYATMIGRLAQHCLCDDNLTTAILSIVAFPFNIKKRTGATDYALPILDTTLTQKTYSGGVTCDQVDVTSLKYKNSDYYVVADFTYTLTEDFFYFEPFTIYDLFIPYLGWVNIPAHDIVNNRIIVYYVVNYQDGSAQVNVYNMTRKEIVYTSTCQLGTVIPVSSTNRTETEQNKTNNNISLSLGLATSAISIIAGVASYNPVAVAMGVMGAAKTVASYVSTANTNYSKASGSISNGYSGLYDPQKVMIRITNAQPHNLSDFTSQYGRLECAKHTISSLTGFTKVGDVKMVENVNISDNELTEIETILKSGFIIAT